MILRMHDSTASSKDDDGARLSVRTPPKGVATTPARKARGPAALRRDVIIDTGCLDLFQERFGGRASAHRTFKLDIARQLSGGEAGVLSKAAAVVFGVHTAQGLPTSDLIEQLRALVPHVGIYVIVRRVGEVSRLMPALAAAGVDEVFCLETRSDERHFEKTIRTRLAAPAPEAELRLLWKWFKDSPERSLVMHCVRNGFRLDDWSVRAAMFSLARKTMQNRVSALGLPSPGVMARCGRVLHMQELERLGVAPATQIAEVLGFPSVVAMQRARRRLRNVLLSRGRQSLVFASLLR